MSTNQFKSDKEKVAKLLKATEKDSRSCVIECSVYLEEMVSKTLGTLLNLDWGESQSLGFGSGSLSFDAKIRLIHDIKSVDKESKIKFQSVMAIRNKFAHLAEIDSFESYFKLIKGSKDQKANLQKWYPNLSDRVEDIEQSYKSAFFRLTLDLIYILMNLKLDHIAVNAREQGRIIALEKLISQLKPLLNSSAEGKKLYLKAIDQAFDQNAG